MNERYDEAATERSKTIQPDVIYFVFATFIYLVAEVFFMLCLLELNSRTPQSVFEHVCRQSQAKPLQTNNSKIPLR